MTRKRGAALRSDETRWAIDYLEKNPQPIRKDDFRDLVAQRIPPGRAIRKYLAELTDRQSRRDPELPPLTVKPESEQIVTGSNRLAQQTLAHMAVSGHIVLVREGDVDWYIPAGWEGEMPADNGGPQREPEGEEDDDPSPHPREATQDGDEASQDAPATAGITRSSVVVAREVSERMQSLVSERDLTFLRLPVGTLVARGVSVIDGSTATTTRRSDRRLEYVPNPDGSAVLTKAGSWAEEDLGTLGKPTEATAAEVVEEIEQEISKPKRIRPVRYNDYVAKQTGYADVGPDDGQRLPLATVATADNLLPMADPRAELARGLLSPADMRILAEAAETVVAEREEASGVTGPENGAAGRVASLEATVEALEKLVQDQANTITTLAAQLVMVRELLVPRCGWSWDERSNDPSPMPCTAVAHYRVVERRNKGMGVTDACPRHATAAAKRGLVIQPLVTQSPHMVWPLDPSRKST